MRTYRTISERASFSNERIASLQDAFKKLQDIPSAKDLTIYATGSYGRREARPHSDLDLFFLYSGSRKQSPLPRTTEITFFSEIIEQCTRLGFPDFSDGGKYLTIQYFDDVFPALGSPADDYENFFTARVLLLLESTCLFNKTLFDSFTPLQFF